MNIFILQKYFHKSIYMLVFNKYFYKNKKSKLYFGDRVVVLKDLFYGYGWSILTKNLNLINAYI
jgi:hypothetical protein